MGSYQGKRVGTEAAKLRAFMDWVRAEVGKDPLYYNFESTTELARFASFGGRGILPAAPRRGPAVSSRRQEGR